MDCDSLMRYLNTPLTSPGTPAVAFRLQMPVRISLFRLLPTVLHGYLQCTEIPRKLGTVGVIDNRTSLQGNNRVRLSLTPRPKDSIP